MKTIEFISLNGTMRRNGVERFDGIKPVSVQMNGLIWNLQIRKFANKIEFRFNDEPYYWIPNKEYLLKYFPELLGRSSWEIKFRNKNEHYKQA